MKPFAGSHSPSIAVLPWLVGHCVCLAAAAQPATSAALPVATPALPVTLLAKGQSAQTALHRLARDIGLQFSGNADPARTLSADLVDIPLEAALREVLEGRSYYVQWGNAHRPTRVVVLSGTGAEPMSRAARGPAPLRDVGSSGSGTPWRAAAASRLTAPGGVAGVAALHEESKSEDPAVRIDAVERLGERSDANSQALVVRALGDPNEAVRAAAREAYDRQQVRRPSAPNQR
jgi:HEAT repeat protein